MYRSWRLAPAALLLAAVAACGSFAHLVPATSAARAAVIEPVFVASTRVREADGSWGTGRSDTIAYAAYDVSVPSSHIPAQSPRYGVRSLDPARDFVVAGETDFNGSADFSAAVAKSGEAFVYVHGFNTSYSDSIYQLAQIGADIDLRATRVLYAWPSQTQLTGYIHDLDSAAFARSGLERLLDGLARAGTRRIVVVGYSMGAAMVVEALRHMKETGAAALQRLGGVVLMSPDIDVDVFRRQAIEMGGLPQPFVVFSSPKDFTLNGFAQFFGKGAPRLGALHDPGLLADLDLTYVDVTNVPQAKQPGHLPVATAPTMIREINAMPDPDLVLYAEMAATGGLPGAEVKQYGRLTYVTLPKP